MTLLGLLATGIGKQMSIHPEWFLGKPFVDMIRYTSIEVSTIFNFKEYTGELQDLPIGTAIQLQVPCRFTMHYVKQPNGNWNEVTINIEATLEDLLEYSYSTATILYMP